MGKGASMRRVRYAAQVLVGAAVMAASGGCLFVGKPSVRDAAAQSLSYRGLEKTARQQDVSLAAAIACVRQLPEQQTMQQVLGGLPVKMSKCVIVEALSLQPGSLAEEITLRPETPPVVLAVFQTPGSIGFATNAPMSLDDGDEGVDDQAASPLTGEGWRVGVWKLAKGANGESLPPLPDDPTRLLPGEQKNASDHSPALPAAKEHRKVRPGGCLLIVTVIDENRILVAAGVDDGLGAALPGQQVLGSVRRAKGRLLCLRGVR